MSGYEVDELVEIEGKIDALVSPTSEDVWQATRPYDARAIASVAATRAGSGGGGSQPAGAASVIGPFPIAYNTAGITTTGVVLHTFDAPTLVIVSIAFSTTPWAGSDPITFEITAGSNDAAPVENPVLWLSNDMTAVQSAYAPWPGQSIQNFVLADSGDVLGADTFGVSGMTAGVAAVYALVAAL